MPDLPGTGVLRLRRFCSDEECARLRAAMNAGVEEAAEVVDDGYALQPEVRRSCYVEVAAPLHAWIEARLIEARRAAARHFGVPLQHNEGAGLLRYADGGFYRRHVDAEPGGSWPRVISLVLFLNGVDSAAFTGGTLRLYPPGHDVLDIVPETGLLVAFPSGVPHEVLPVAGGARDVAVDWCY
jgi:predicted 2-oxoglutarate/Fe(II)-dependent dioxygenase YbiX